MVLLVMLYKVVLSVESVDEILKCGQLNERCEEVLFPMVPHCIYFSICTLYVRMFFF